MLAGVLTALAKGSRARPGVYRKRPKPSGSQPGHKFCFGRVAHPSRVSAAGAERIRTGRAGIFEMAAAWRQGKNDSALHPGNPAPADWPVCRMLLPKTLPHATLYEYRIAVDPGADSVAGAVAFTDNGLGLHSIQLHTVLNRRAEGIGTELLNYVSEEAVRRGRGEISAALSQKEDAGSHAFLRHRGFEVRSRFATAEGSLAQVYRRQSERCRRAATIGPADGLVVPLSTGMLREAGQLMSEYLSKLQHRPSGANFMPPHEAGIGISHALVVDGAVSGMILVTRNDDMRNVRSPGGAAAISQHARQRGASDAQSRGGARKRRPAAAFLLWGLGQGYRGFCPPDEYDACRYSRPPGQGGPGNRLTL